MTFAYLRRFAFFLLVLLSFLVWYVPLSFQKPSLNLSPLQAWTKTSSLLFAENHTLFLLDSSGGHWVSDTLSSLGRDHYLEKNSQYWTLRHKSGEIVTQVAQQDEVYLFFHADFLWKIEQRGLLFERLDLEGRSLWKKTFSSPPISMAFDQDLLVLALLDGRLLFFHEDGSLLNEVQLRQQEISKSSLPFLYGLALEYVASEESSYRLAWLWGLDPTWLVFAEFNVENRVLSVSSVEPVHQKIDIPREHRLLFDQGQWLFIDDGSTLGVYKLGSKEKLLWPLIPQARLLHVAYEEEKGLFYSIEHHDAQKISIIRQWDFAGVERKRWELKSRITTFFPQESKGILYAQGQFWVLD